MLKNLMRRAFEEEVIDRLNASPCYWPHDNKKAMEDVKKTYRDMFLLLGVENYYDKLVVNTEVRKDGNSYDYFVIVKNQIYCEFKK